MGNIVKVDMSMANLSVEIPDNIKAGPGLEMFQTGTDYNGVNEQTIEIRTDNTLDMFDNKTYNINGFNIFVGNSSNTLNALPIVMANIEIIGYKALKVYLANSIIEFQKDELQNLYKALLMTEPDGDLKFELEGLVLENV
jgi:hypothetical protein